MATIAIDYTPAYEQGAGIGRYVRELVSALAHIETDHRYRLFVAGTDGSDLPAPISESFEWCWTRLSPLWLARFWHRLQIPVPADRFVGHVDLFHATDFVLPPLSRGTRSILTVHDLSFVHVPDAASPRLRRYLEVVVPRSARRATHILADSQATKTDLVNLYEIAESKITVLLSGVDSRFRPSEQKRETLRDKYGLPDAPYILSVGTVQPRKNYGRLIQALRLVREQGHAVELVIAGGRGWLESDIYETVKAEHITEHVHFIGYVDDADLPALYTHAQCFAFPSLYEGFGLPLLESMACGTPVLTSSMSSLPEVVGDAGLTVDPYDVEAIAQGLIRLVSEDLLRSTLIRRGLERVKDFTWARSAHTLLQTYQRVLES